MTESILDIPKRPTSMADFWTEDGKKEVHKQGLVWLKYRNSTIGPFPNRSEAHWYDGQIQDILSGWNHKEFFAGRIFPYQDNWYVERWDKNDGPFQFGEAVNHRQNLHMEYNHNSDKILMQKAGHAVRGGIKWGPISESGRVRVNQDGKVKIGEKVTSEDPVTSLEKPRKDSSLWQKAKKATDDIVDVSLKFDKDKFLDDIIGPLQDLDGYCGYVVSDRHGLVHIDPSTGRMHRNDHICNQQCRDLATRAKAEYLKYEESKKEAKPEEPLSQVLYRDDVPVILGLMMDRMGITSFKFEAKEILEFKGIVSIVTDDVTKSLYTVRKS